MAARTGAVIVPVAAVGVDDAYEVLLDVDELLEVRRGAGLATSCLQAF